MPTHGKRSTYINYHCRCDECRCANRTYQSRMRLERSQRPPSEIPHGLGGYLNWSCRCGVCTEANRKVCAEYQTRRREQTAAAAEVPATTAQTPNPSERN